MSDAERVEELLAEFRAGHERGEQVDLAALLERALADQRQTLADRIDHYLMDAPRRAWDPVAYEASMAKQSVDRVFESLEGVSGSWPELLPHLRNRARIKRRDLVERLAAALGVADRTERVAEYYNDMEHGRLPAAGVSERVFEALAAIVGSTAEAIRAAGAGARPDAEGGALFARKALPNADFDLLHESSDAGSAAPPPAAEPARRDEVDELFTGG